MRKSESLLAWLQVFAILSILSFIFYNSLYGLLLLAPLGLVFYGRWKQYYEAKMKEKFINQFRDYLQNLSASLRSGYAVENAMKEARKELERQYKYEKNPRILSDLAKMENLIQMNVPIERILTQWSKKIALDDVENFVTVFCIAKRSGGDSIEIIRKAVNHICEKIEVQREVKTILTAKRLEFRIMVAVPIGILCYMRVTFPDLMNILYGNILGVSIMTVCLGIYAVAYCWGESLISIEI